jgi:hypothetical protein
MGDRKERFSVVWFCTICIAGMSALAVVLGVGGCTGVIDAGEVEIGTFALKADVYGALQMAECVGSQGEQACGRYPNPTECESMDISVRANAKTVAFCVRNRDRHQLLESAGDGIPIVCRVGTAGGCVQCVDIHGSTVLNVCGLEGIAPELTGDVAPEPTGDVCTSENAVLRYAEELNKLLSAEGVNFTYQPDLSEPGSSVGHSSRWGVCERAARLGEFYDRPGVGYCQEGNRWTDGKVCRCGAMSNAVLVMLCEELSEQCDPGLWEMALWREVGNTSKWLSIRTYERSRGESSGEGETSGEGESSGEDDITCTGSPLVLDLAGDGLNLTSVEQGVRFDLLGHGSVQTAWIQGDDALLALDRDGNGVIDSGLELFGESIAPDGFQALAELDRSEYGGNQNGVVEATDVLFLSLRVWNDRNRDGFSQPAELRSLPEAGVQALNLTSRYEKGSFDEHGNDVGLQGHFVRPDESPGCITDVFFVYREVVDNLLARR